MASISNHTHRVLRRIGALTTIGIACATLATAPAYAQPANGSGSDAPKGCPVEDEHGNVSYVPVGTVIGLFHCGSDGEWHFGWLTTDIVHPSGPTTHGGLPVAATTTHHVAVATTR